MKRALSILIGLTLVLLVSGELMAKNVNLKMSTMATAKDPWGMHVLRTAKAVEEGTNGAVKITPYLSSKLGAETDVIKQVARGRVEMGGFALAGVSTMVPEVALLGTPFLFDTWEQNDCVLDNYIAPLLDEMLQKKGLKMIQYTDTGSFSTFAKKPIITPADAKNVKLRINQSKFSVLMWQSVGASPIPLPMSEFPAALQTGMVKGGDLNPIFYLAFGFPKLAPHLTITEHTRQPGFYLMSLRVWKRLSASQQRQLMASLEPVSVLRKQVRGLQAMMVQKYKKAGGPVYMLTPEQKQQWQDAVVPNQVKIVDMVGGESARFWRLIQKGKAACKK